MPSHNENDKSSDEQLIIHYSQTGDQASFELLYNRHYKDLVSFIFNRYVRDHAAAEDIAQQAFLDVHLVGCGIGPGKAGNAKIKYRAGRSFNKWLYWLGGNKAINYGTKARCLKRGDGCVWSLDSAYADGKSDAVVADSGRIKVVDDDIALGILPERVFEALATLSEQHRHVVNRIYYEDSSERDVAAELNTTRHQVRRLLAEAISELKEVLIHDALPA